MPQIKRYPNRKLYDTDAKRYVTLDEIAAMIRDGHEVRVLDHESGDDVTSLTLTQIILEQEKKSSGYLPNSLLMNLIRSSNTTLEGWRRSFQQGISSLGVLGRSPADAFEEHLARLKEQGKLTVEQAQNLLKLDGLLSEILHSLNVPTQSDLHSLQEQVDVLSARLGEMNEAPPQAAQPAAPAAPEEPRPKATGAPEAEPSAAQASARSRKAAATPKQ